MLVVLDRSDLDETRPGLHKVSKLVQSRYQYAKSHFLAESSLEGYGRGWPKLSGDLEHMRQRYERRQTYEEWSEFLAERLPKELSKLAGVEDRLKLRIRNFEGVETVMDFRVEKSKGSIRYVVKGWSAFMRSNGITQGDNCSFAYHESVGTLFLTQVSK